MLCFALFARRCETILSYPIAILGPFAFFSFLFFFFFFLPFCSSCLLFCSSLLISVIASDIFDKERKAFDNCSAVQCSAAGGCWT